MEFRDRLELLLQETGMNQSALADRIGVNSQRISHILKTGSSPNYSLITLLLDGFPELSAEWLCRGKGSMWKSDKLYPKSEKSEDNRVEDVSWKELVGRVKRLEDKVEGK